MATRHLPVLFECAECERSFVFDGDMGPFIRAHKDGTPADPPATLFCKYCINKYTMDLSHLPSYRHQRLYRLAYGRALQAHKAGASMCIAFNNTRVRHESRGYLKGYPKKAVA